MRFGIAIRLIGIVALVAFIGLQGSALKNHAFDGTAGHYTVVMRDGQSAAAVAKDQHVDIDHVTSDGVDSAYVATIDEDKAQHLMKDSRVAYVALDGTMKVQRSWYETMKLTINQQTSNIFS